jgi:hypothetical protein
MNLELTDEQTEALIRELSQIVRNDRYPLSPGQEVSMFSEDEPDLKQYKVDRVTQDGQFVERVAEYATEAEAMAHRRRGDWYYRIYKGRRQLWPVKA